MVRRLNLNVSRRLKLLLLLLGLVLIAAVAGTWMLPRVIAAMPSQYRQRLPHELVRLVTTPLPTALPAPAVGVSQADITIPDIILPTATRESTAPTATATPLATPTQTRSLEAAPLPSALPATSTPIPSPTLTVPPTSTPTATVEPLPAAAVIEGLENIPQKFNNCGPTNLSISLSFYGHAVDQLDIAAILKPSYDDRNVSPEELVRYVNERTPLRATLHYGGNLALLKRFIAFGFPVVIEKGLTPNEWEGWMGHYLTLSGYNDFAEEFYSMDTFLGPWDGSARVDTYDNIARQWGHFNYNFFVVFPPEEESVVHSILDGTWLDPVVMWQSAALKAQSEIENDATNAFSWFNLGTSLTRLGQLTDQLEFYQNAAAAFDKAREIGLPARMLWYQFDPYVAYLEVDRIDDVLTLTNATMAGGGRDVEETHLYRGHALRALGDAAGANAAYRQALQLNPNFLLAQQALN
jgi:hypothetical protein